MPEYLERRYGARARTLYACLIVVSYVFANFALVFYTGAFALEQMWGFNKIAAVWVLAVFTGAYTIYGGLASVAWTDFFQCVILMGGGIYVFCAGMSMIGWNFEKVIGTGQHAHLIAPASHEVPWTALVVLALSTNVWYYATDQFINQRCLGAKNEWHSKMGVLLAGGLQLLLPLATTFPGMVYAVINPHLQNPDAAYPSVVAAVVPIGLRGLVAAAVIGAIMSTISGLVNSTATMVTLDIFRRWKGKGWSEPRLVRFGQWAGGTALLIGALFAPAVMKWENMFRYCQDIWAPMAAPAVVVFLAGALWKPASQSGACACLWLAILTIPFTFAKQFLADKGVHFLPPSLENSMVFAGGVFLAAAGLLGILSLERRIGFAIAYSIGLCGVVFYIASVSAEATAILVLLLVLAAIVALCWAARKPTDNMWDRSMLGLPKGEIERWYSSLWLWWLALGICFAAIYVYFW